MYIYIYTYYRHTINKKHKCYLNMSNISLSRPLPVTTWIACGQFSYGAVRTALDASAMVPYEKTWICLDINTGLGQQLVLGTVKKKHLAAKRWMSWKETINLSLGPYISKVILFCLCNEWPSMQLWRISMANLRYSYEHLWFPAAATRSARKGGRKDEVHHSDKIQRPWQVGN